MKKVSLVLLVSVMLISFVSVANASIIIQPVDASGASNGGQYTPTQLINNSGVNAGSTGDAVPATWNALTSTYQYYGWLLAHDFSTEGSTDLTFDLGDSYQVEAFHVWNYAWQAALGRCTKDITLQYSTDGTTWTTAQDFTLAQEKTEVTELRGNTYTLDTPVTASYMRMVVKSNYGDTDAVGMGEVRFIGVVPEPATIGLLLFGIIGFIRRR